MNIYVMLYFTVIKLYTQVVIRYACISEGKASVYAIYIYYCLYTYLLRYAKKCIHKYLAIKLTSNSIHFVAEPMTIYWQHTKTPNKVNKCPHKVNINNNCYGICHCSNNNNKMIVYVQQLACTNDNSRTLERQLKRLCANNYNNNNNNNNNASANKQQSYERHLSLSKLLFE